MPTYEYQCDACNHNFDDFQSMNDKPHKKCPKCKKSKLRRVFGIGAAILFKGSGFYETDYRSESYKAGAKADAEKNKPASTDKTDTNGTAKTTSTTNTSSTEGGKSESKPSAKKAKSSE